MSIHMDSTDPTRKLLYTPVEAAEKLGLGRSTVYELLSTKRLESVKIGRNRRIPAAALDEFVAALRANVE